MPSVRSSINLYTSIPLDTDHEPEPWLGQGASRPHSIVRAGIRTVRVFWSEARAVIYTKPPQLPDALDAVLRFTVAERETLGLERKLKSVWPAIEKDKSLTHAVTGLQDGRQGQVNEMTELLVDMQSAYMRVGIALQQPNSTTAEPSKRLFGELAIASGLYDRAPLLAEPIQFAVDHYELANTRLIEARFARREMVNAWIGHLLETCIILLLIGELAALIYEITVFEPRLPDKSSAAATVTAVPEVPPAPAENTPAPQAAAPVQTVEPSPAAPAPKQPDAAAAPSPAAKPEAAQAPEATAKPSAVGAPRQWPNQPPRAQPTRRGAQKPSAWKAHKKASRKKIRPKAKPLHQSPNPALQQIN
jgi:hypothetical protein